MKRLVVDTDPGVDDALAIMMASAHPDTALHAITTVAGNVSLDHTSANACKLVEFLGLDTPVFVGCGEPLMGTPNEDAASFHGSDGLGDADVPPASVKPNPGHASHAICSIADEYTEAVDLVALGPLTNVAVALMLDPDLPEKYRGLTIMGGAIRAQGNTANYTAEYNFFRDPDAAKIVLTRWPMVTIVDWETTLAYPIGTTDLTRIFATKTKRADFFRRISQVTLDRIESIVGDRVFLAADPIAMATVLDSGVASTIEQRYVAIENAGGLSRGQSLVDWMGLTGNRPNASLVTKISTERFLALIEAALT